MWNSNQRERMCACLGGLAMLACTVTAVSDVRVQDIARLQGQRTNKLMGYGLVVGLPGTGDGEKYLPTMRALVSMHERFHAPVFLDSDLKGNKSVALVAVEATIPEHGAREGQALDVTVSVLGTAKSLRGGQLLTTPLQYAMFDAENPDTQHILALAGGRIEVAEEAPTRGFVPAGAVLEQDFIYSFIQSGTLTLVLDDAHAGWTWAHMIARAVNHEMSGPTAGPPGEASGEPLAVASGPRQVVVRIPPYELANPARFIAAVEETPLFDLPEQAALVTINRGTRSVSFTSAVRVSPTVLQIPGVGMVRIGDPPAAGQAASAQPMDADTIGFDELFQTLSAIKVTPEQLIAAIEHLHKTGTLHAQLQYK